MSKIVNTRNDLGILENGDLLDTYTAKAICEGFYDGTSTGIDEIKSWALLIQSKFCWSLQSWFGRHANRLIECGLITREGIIDWDLYDELKGW